MHPLWLNRIVTAALLALACASGCALFDRRERPPPQISDSQLNWLEITYRPGDTRRPPCRISMIGVGSLSVRTGASPLVADDFAHDPAHPNWNDIDAQRISLTPEDVRQIFQSLVNNGLLDAPRKDRTTASANGTAAVVFVGRLDREHVRRVASEPELVSRVERLLDLLGVGVR